MTQSSSFELAVDVKRLRSDCMARQSCLVWCNLLWLLEPGCVRSLSLGCGGGTDHGWILRGCSASQDKLSLLWRSKGYVDSISCVFSIRIIVEKKHPYRIYPGEAKIGKSILGCLSSLMYLLRKGKRFRNSVVSMASTPACIAETDGTSLNLRVWSVSSGYVCLAGFCQTDMTLLFVLIPLE